MGSPINWGILSGDTAVLNSDLYLKYSSTTFANLNSTTIKDDIKSAIASNESAGVVAYLCWLLRVLALVG